MSASCLGSLVELEHALDALLLLLDGPAGDEADSLRRAEQACARAFAAFRRHLESARAADAEITVELREKLEDVQKRQAVAASLLVRRREALETGLRRVRETRRRLRTAGGHPPTGRSCDVRG